MSVHPAISHVDSIGHPQSALKALVLGNVEPTPEELDDTAACREIDRIEARAAELKHPASDAKMDGRLARSTLRWPAPASLAEDSP